MTHLTQNILGWLWTAVCPVLTLVLGASLALTEPTAPLPGIAMMTVLLGVGLYLLGIMLIATLDTDA